MVDASGRIALVNDSWSAFARDVPGSRPLPGGPQWVEVEAWPLDDAGRVVVRWTDVSARRADHTALLHASMHDDLTALPNRFLIEERLAQASAASRRGADGLVAVLVMDIDDFTAINSAYDHAVADEVLIGISRRLPGCVRPSDTRA